MMNSPVAFESRSFKFAEALARETAVAAPSLELTASDGTGLVLVSLSARVVIEEPLAFTEISLVFHNPQPRQLEGRFRIGLPPGASVSRFAMRIGTHWQEGEVVERQAARRAYEDFLHRAQDPALLEHEAGNEFSARVFPIEANGRKELIVSYSHELRSDEDVYRLPLVGLPEIAELEIRALVGRAGAAQAAVSSLGGTAASWQVVEVRKARWKPDVDFEVRPSASQRAGLRHDNLAVVRVRPELPAEPDEIGSLLLLVDTSASRALGYERQVEIVSKLVRGLAGGRPSCPVAIACFDQAVEVVFEGAAADFGALAAAKLTDRRPLGASDLTGALAWAASRKGARYERVLVVSDGVATAGDTEPEKVTAAAKALSEAGVKRLDALAVGGLRDDAALRRLVTAGLERDGTVCEGGLSLEDIARRLLRATKSGIQVEVPGASWVWPARLDGVQPGDSVLVYADVPAGKPVRVLLDKKAVMGGDLTLDSVERPLLERAWVKARIERLEDMRARPDTDPDVRGGLQKQVLDLSVKHRVLSPYTAMLVLETEADYARFHIDRNALTDILSVGLSGIEVLRRTGANMPVPQAPAPPKEAPVQIAKRAAKPRPASGAPDARPASRSAPDEDDLLFSLSALEREEGRAELADEAAAPMAADLAGPNDALETVTRSFPDQQASGPELDAFMADPEPVPRRERDEFSERTRVAQVADSPAIAAPAAIAPPPFAPPRAAPPPPPRPAAFAPPPAAFAAPAAPMFAPGEAPADLAPPAARPAPAPAAEPESPSPLRRIANAVSGAVSSLREMVSPAAPPPEPPHPPAPPPPPPGPSGQPQPPPPREPEPSILDSWTGTFREVMAVILQGDHRRALEMALAWRERSPGDVLALIAIGEAAELLGEIALAARAYGSIIDLFPSRADLRRFAGERLSRVAAHGALDLAIDTYRKAVESRPDHPSSHRLLGMALLRAGRFEEAFEAIAAGQARTYPSKFPGIPRILTEDLGLCAAAWIKAAPSKKADVLVRLSRAGATLEEEPSVRFVLVWETDANDVDFHIHDAHGGHAYFREKVLPSGGELYADVTQGYGPECFTIRGAPATRAYPYKLQAHYYRQGPMGYGMGALQTVEHDGKGGFGFGERPYVVMRDGAYVDLGMVMGPVPIKG